MAASVEWARERGIIVASDECYAEFTYDADGAPTAPITALAAGLDGVLAVHSLSKRSNMAGLRAGFVAGDAELVTYLGEIRKHGGLMTPAPVQAAAAAALGDDEHVREQQARYARAGARSRCRRSATRGLVHDGGPSTFYLWLRAGSGPSDGWAITADLAKTGLLVAPGDFYGDAGADHARLALTVTDDQLALVVRAPHRMRRPATVDDLATTITALWEGRDDLGVGDAGRRSAARRPRRDRPPRPGEARVAEVVDDEVVVHEWLKYAILLLFRLAQMETDRARSVRVRRQDPAEARLRAGAACASSRARRRAGARTSRRV